MKKFMVIMSAAVLAFSIAGCGGSSDKNADAKSGTQTENTDVGENNASDSGAESKSAGLPQVTSDEISQLGEGEFYVANGMSESIRELYVAVANSGEWGSNYVTANIESSSRVKFTLSNLDSSVKYDIRIVSDSGETTEYYGFDMTSTVQVTFYDNAQCDVATI